MEADSTDDSSAGLLYKLESPSTDQASDSSLNLQVSSVVMPQSSTPKLHHGYESPNTCKKILKCRKKIQNHAHSISMSTFIPSWTGDDHCSCERPSPPQNNRRV
eukprot:358163-Chlamydomonas_euryale.AAC.5